MKLKGLTEVKKRCPDGEVYVFRNGVAVVPGLRVGGKPVKVSLLEFRTLCVEVEK